MPQKKNPDPLELIRGKSGRLIGHLTGWMATMKGLPSGYNKDLQEDKEAVFDAEDNVAGALATLVGVIDGLEIFPATTTAAASGLLLATDVADFLVGKGMPFREAHEVVGGMVRQLLAERRDFGALDDCRNGSGTARSSTNPCAASSTRMRPFAHARRRNPLSRKRFRPRWPK